MNVRFIELETFTKEVNKKRELEFDANALLSRIEGFAANIERAQERIIPLSKLYFCCELLRRAGVGADSFITIYYDL